MFYFYATARIEQPKLCNLMPRNARIFCISYYPRTTFEEITQSLEYDTKQPPI